MPNFYRVSVEGTATAQSIANILYYVDDATGTAVFDPTIMGDLALAVVNMWGSDVAPHLSSLYSGTLVQVTLIDEEQTTLSPYGVDAANTASGADSGDLDTPGVSVVVGFRTTFMSEGQTARVPKRSYLALGPIVSTRVANNGLQQLSAGAITDIEEALARTLEGIETNFRPCRVGRVSPENGPSFGEVVDAQVRPFATFRRSRITRPSGS